MPDNDFLKITIQNIYQKLIEIDTKISAWDDRINKIEDRLTILETEKRLVSSILGNGTLWKVVFFGFAALIGYLTGNPDGTSVKFVGSAHAAIVCG